MRDVLVRLALAGCVGIAIAGCATSETALPVGTLPNGSGGAPQANVSNQPPAPGTIAGKPLVGSFAPGMQFVAFNTSVPPTADAPGASDYGTDPQFPGSGPPPTTPGSSHVITFNGNNTPVVSFRYTSSIGALIVPLAAPLGQLSAQNYGAVVVHAPAPLSTFVGLPVPTLFLEFVGGSGATAYDVRTTCAVPAVPVTSPPTPVTMNGGLVRYVCPLPAYGSPSSTGLIAPVLAGASGTFTPTSPTLYVGEQYATSQTPPAGINTLIVDDVYAQQGTL
ncbi:MAG: hypothetical protein NVSMB59_15880 [Vulcanimicrobiaceae bacterium]